MAEYIAKCIENASSIEVCEVKDIWCTTAQTGMSTDELNVFKEDPDELWCLIGEIISNALIGSNMSLNRLLEFKEFNGDSL